MILPKKDFRANIDFQDNLSQHQLYEISSQNLPHEISSQNLPHEISSQNLFFETESKIHKILS